MTAADFSKFEDNRVALAQLLLNPVLQQALEILESELAPKVDRGLDTNPVASAAAYHQAAGANYVLRGLERLTQPPAERKTPRPRQLFTSVDEIPEHLRPQTTEPATP